MNWLLAVGALVPFTGILQSTFVLPKLAVLAIALLLTGPRRDRVPLLTPILAFVAAMLLTSLTSRDVFVSVMGPYNQPFFCLLAVALVLAAYLTAPQDIIPPLCLAGALVSLYAIAQALGWNFNPYPLQQGRASSTMGSPVYLGAAYCVLIPASAYAHRFGLWYGLPSLLLCAAGLGITYSKGASLAVMCGLGAWAVLIGEIRRATVLALVIPGLLAVNLYAIRLNARDSERIELAKIAWKSFQDRPLLGSGPDTFRLEFSQHRTPGYIRLTHSTIMGQNSAHNAPLQVMSTMGIVGLIAYLWLSFAFLRWAWKERDPLSLAVIVGLLVQQQFNPIPTNVYMIAALVFGRWIYWRDFPHKPSPWLWRLALYPSVLIVGVMVFTDYHYTKGVRTGSTRALTYAAISPEIIYHNTLADRLNYLARVNRDKKMAQRAVNASAQSVRLHPSDPLAWFSLASTSITQWMLGDFKAMERAEIATIRALRLDASYESSLKAKIITSAILKKQDPKNLAMLQAVSTLTGDVPAKLLRRPNAAILSGINR